VSAKRTAIFILGFSLLAIIVSVVASGFGIYQISEGFDVEEEAVFVDTDGTINVVNYGSYSVYVKSDYSCEDVTVSIYEGEWEYFYKDCDPIMNEKGWYYVGYFVSDFDGTMSIESNYQIAIVDDLVFLESGGLAMLVSGGICCLGIIGIIIAITILLTAKDEVNNTSLQQGFIIIDQPQEPETEAESRVDLGNP